MAPADQRTIDAQLDAAIRQAIAEKRVVRFKVHGCVRIAEPHDYGIKNGTFQLLVYQIGGESRSGRLPNWRRVMVSQISDFEILERSFAGGRKAPSGMHSSWDQVFARVNQR